MSEGCIAPFERLIHKDSTPLVRIILHSRGTLHAGRKRSVGESNMSHSYWLLLTGKVARRINCHFTVISASCSAGLLLSTQGLWHDVLSSLSCGGTA